MSEPQPGRIGPTRTGTLAGLALFGVVIGWAVHPVLEQVQGVAPSVPWSSILVLAFIGAILLGTAWTTYRSIHRHHRRVEPQRAVNLLVLAKASALVGALVAGGYLGYGLSFLGSMSGDLPRQQLVRSLLSVLAAALVAVGGVLLERACKVPKGPDDERDDRDDQTPIHHP